jgi:hypothetical protein
LIHDPRRHSTSHSAASIPPPAIDELKIIVDLICAEVAKTTLPTPCGRIASLITAQHATIASDWNGLGVFRKFIESLDLSPMRVDWSSSGGHVFDPRRHTRVMEGISKSNGHQTTTVDWEMDQDLLQIAMQIHDITGAPLLSPRGYETLFLLIETDLAGHAFDLKETGKRVRDATRASKYPVNRADVNWILRGLLIGGHAFGSGEDDARTLSRITVLNLRSLCLREQLVIEQDLDDILARWINPGAYGETTSGVVS